jgi:outer membrane protein, multidrug efflux system
MVGARNGARRRRRGNAAMKSVGQLRRALSRAFRAPVILTFFLAAGTGGCDLEWARPDPSVPPPQRFVAARTGSAPPAPAGADFATLFGSAEMKELVAGALGDNLDIAAAAARVTEADAQARVLSAPLWPNVSLSGVAERTLLPAALAGSALNGNSAGNPFGSALVGGQPAFVATRASYFSLGLGASYEIDFWGKNQDASLAARLLAKASRFDRDVVEISAIAAVMNVYLQVLATQDRLRIANQNVVLASKVYDAIKARREAGAATELDTAQQETVLEQQRATIPPLEQNLRQMKNVLAVLRGCAPESLNVRGGALTALRFPSVPPGLPSEVLLRRPDIARAEAALASQEYSVLQARAAFFPSIALTGQYGLQSIVLSNLLRPEAIAWQLAVSAAQPLFDGFQLQGEYELQKARYSELAALYRKQIFTALSDVENALIAIQETERSLRIQTQATEAARHAYDAARARLAEGTIDIVTMATNETAYFQNEDLLVQARLAHFEAAVSLFQALGGGWSLTTREIEIARANEAYEANKGPWP